MKQWLTVLTILSFISIAVFGFMAMGHGNEHGGEACLATTINGKGCPKEFGLAGVLNFHLGTFKSFSTAVFAEAASVMYLALVLFAVVIISAIRLQSFSNYKQASFTYRRRYLDQPSASFFKSENFRWLSLHENSPALV